MKQIHEDPSLKILEPSDKQLTPVRELTMYPSQFPILLRERMRGQSVAEAAEYFRIKPADVVRLLKGRWRPSKEICRQMGLKMVYAIGADQALAKRYARAKDQGDDDQPETENRSGFWFHEPMKF